MGGGGGEGGEGRVKWGRFTQTFIASQFLREFLLHFHGLTLGGCICRSICVKTRPSPAMRQSMVVVGVM